MRADGENFDSQWRQLSSVAPLAYAYAAPFVQAHYLHRWPAVVVLILGYFHAGQPKGCMVFALPPRETAKRYGGVTWELARLYLDDGIPRNGESWFIGQAVRYIRRQRPDVAVLVSYADPSAGHTGVIYKAANWKADGRTDQERKTPRFDYQWNGKRYSRRGHLPPEAVPVRVPRVSKWRFVYELRPIAPDTAQTTAGTRGNGDD